MAKDLDMMKLCMARSSTWSLFIPRLLFPRESPVWACIFSLDSTFVSCLYWKRAIRSFKWLRGEGPPSRRYRRTAALKLIMQSCDEDDNFFFVFPCSGAPVEWNWQGKNEVIGGKKTDPVPLCPPQIPPGLSQDRIRASAARDWRLTAWAMARPSVEHIAVWEANRHANAQEIPYPNRTRHWYLSRTTNAVHALKFYFVRSILILSSQLGSGLPSYLFPSGFSNKMLYAFGIFSHVC
jgi:hypothetical protein